MKLLITPTSPYARKTRILVLEKSLKCEMVMVSPWDDDANVRDNNPLRKAPILIVDTHQTLIDSRLICEYLDTLSDSPRFIPDSPTARFAVKNREAIIEGAMDSLLIPIMTGRVSPNMAQSAEWRQWLISKTQRALEVLEQNIAQRDGFDISDVACFCLLDFWLFRAAAANLPDWRDSYPRLTAWFEHTGSRESLQQTDPR